MFAPNMYSKEARRVIKSHVSHNNTKSVQGLTLIDQDPTRPLFLYLPFMALHTPFVGIPPRRFKWPKQENHEWISCFVSLIYSNLSVFRSRGLHLHLSALCHIVKSTKLISRLHELRSSISASLL